jgi:hypothetical protein
MLPCCSWDNLFIEAWAYRLACGLEVIVELQTEPELHLRKARRMATKISS